MKQRSPIQATILAGAVSVLSGLALTGFCLLQAAPGGFGASLSWALLGWAAVSLPAVLTLAPLVRRFGRPGSAFMAAMTLGMAARFGLALGGALLVFFFAPTGPLSAPLDAALAYGAGIVFGYVPMFVFESVWFLRMARMESAAAPGPRISMQPESIEGNRC